MHDIISRFVFTHLNMSVRGLYRGQLIPCQVLRYLDKTKYLNNQPLSIANRLCRPL